MADKEPSQAEITDALRAIEAEERNLHSVKNGLATYLNLKSSLDAMEKRKANIDKDLQAKDARSKALEDGHTQSIQALQKEYTDKQAEHQKAFMEEKGRDGEELLKLKKEVTVWQQKARNAEKLAQDKIQAAEEALATALKAHDGVRAKMDQDIKEREAKLSTIEGKFNDLARELGVGA
jgi:hypothetical protein